MKENNLFLKCLTNGIVTHIINVVRNKTVIFRKDVDYMESGPSSRRQNYLCTALLFGQSNIKIKYNRTFIRIHR